MYRQFTSTRHELILQLLVRVAVYSYCRLVARPRRRIPVQCCHLLLHTRPFSSPHHHPWHCLNRFTSRGHDCLYLSRQLLPSTDWQTTDQLAAVLPAMLASWTYTSTSCTCRHGSLAVAVNTDCFYESVRQVRSLFHSRPTQNSALTKYVENADH